MVFLWLQTSNSYSVKNIDEKKTKMNAFFAVPHCYGMVSSGFKIVLDLNRNLFEKVLFWNGQNRIPSKWDRFLSHSLEKLLRMDSSNWRTHSKQSNIILRKKRRILRRSLNFWALSYGFNRNFNSKLTALQHDTLKLVPKMAEPSISCTPQLTILISKKNISKIVWATNNGEHTVG